MSTKTSTAGKKKTSTPQNTIETLKNLGTSALKQPIQEVSKMGMDVFDQLLGNYDDDEYDFPPLKKEKEQKKPQQQSRVEFTVFNSQEHFERRKTEQRIDELAQLIQSEARAAKQAGSELVSSINALENQAMNLPAEPGEYHINFFEAVLTFIRTLRLKINESKTWLQALISKKQKRGSAFASLSKKKGTQYSLSQELQSARSIQ